MRLNHEEIRGKLPEYLKESSLPDEIKEHLKTCTECSEEVSLLKTFNQSQVPEPGDMFFETLPQKVKVSLREKKRNPLLKLAPVFTLIALVVISGYMLKTVITGTQVIEEAMYSSDPLSTESYDLSGLDPEDIPSISENIDDNDIYIADEPSFIMEFVSLTAEEIGALYEVLNIENHNGGV